MIVFKQHFDTFENAIGKFLLRDSYYVKTLYPSLRNLTKFNNFRKSTKDWNDTRGFTHFDSVGRYLSFYKRSDDVTLLRYTYDVENDVNIPEGDITEPIERYEKTVFISDQESRFRIKLIVHMNSIYVDLQVYSTNLWRESQRFSNVWQVRRKLCLNSFGELYSKSSKDTDDSDCTEPALLENALTGYVRHEEITIFTNSHFVSFSKKVLASYRTAVPIISYPLSSHIACNSLTTIGVMVLITLVILNLVFVCLITGFCLYKLVQMISR